MGAFYRLGKLCAQAPVRISLTALICSVVLCLGLLNMRMQTDPQALWVPPNSVAAGEEAKFNALFHPFFRIQQLIFYVDDDQNEEQEKSEQTSDLVQQQFLTRMAEIELEIKHAVIPSARNVNASLSLRDFCYKPIKGKGCLVTSPLQYWRGNISLLTNDPDIKLTTACQTTDPTLKDLPPCMDENGVPVMRNVVFGGLSKDPCHENPDPCGETTPQAKALMVTFLLHDYPDNESYTQDVEEWEEQVFLKIAQNAASTDLHGMKLTYMAQRSIADSLEVQTSQNAFIVVVSYLVMFLYVSMSLGKFNDPVLSRYGVGVTGILIVLLSLGISMGVCCSLLQLEVTMITLEVVPFLILAIGVDNMFILTNEFDRLKILRGLSTVTMNTRDRHHDQAMLEQVLGETMSNVGPSILVAAVAECLAFLVGALTNIPALESFCIVAAVAVLADFMLQITWFASALVLDAKRVRARRYDLLPWVKRTISLTPEKRKQQRTTSAESVLTSSEPLITPSSATSAQSSNNNTGVIKTFVEKRYVPFMMKGSTKFGVLATAATLLAISLLGCTQLPLGLEQELAVPSDFYLHEYFQMQTKYGEAGPLAYVVLEQGTEYTNGQVQVDINGLLDQLSNLHEYVQSPIYSWLHTFNQWRQMRFFLQDKIDQDLCDCPTQPMDPFPYEMLSFVNGNVTPNELFYPLVKNFTEISIDSQCCQQFSLCGAQYEGDIIFTYKDDSASDVNGIRGSRMRFQVNAMTNQSMFVNSYYYLHEIVHNWNAKTSISAFPYTLYFVYYEQYTYIQGVAIQSILLALAVVFISILMLMERNVRLSMLVTLCVLSMTLTQLGFLFVWNQLSSVSTSINAVSVVNLLACVGLGVEFCIHLTHQFVFSQRNRLGVTANDHTKHAISSVGASIISGITLTKFCGIGVLAFAPSMLFRVYFFRMYMGIVVLGFFHGMVLLPVLLSLFGQRKTSDSKAIRSFLLSEELDDDDLDDEVHPYS